VKIENGQAIVGSELARVSHLLDLGVHATQQVWGKNCRIQGVLPDLPPGSTEAEYHYDTGYIHCQPSFLIDCATFTSKRYREFVPSAQFAFLQRFSKGLLTFHHESIHSTEDPEKFFAEQGTGQGSFLPIKEAMVEVAVEREESEWLRHTGVREHEPRIGLRGAPTHAYPAHVRALNQLLDHADRHDPGVSRALVRGLIRTGTGRHSVETLAAALHPQGNDLGKANLVLGLNRGFDTLDRDLEASLAAIQRQPSSYDAVLRDHLKLADQVSAGVVAWIQAREVPRAHPVVDHRLARVVDF
jgi:hypothetical protein